VKPANIFLVPTDEGKLIKLVDFGVAKTTRMPEARKLTQDGLLIGTPEYISRDQIVSGASADHHADLWALAVVAYECLVGEVPFGGSTIGMVCANIVAGDYVLPSKVRDDLPVALDRWFEKCFATEPSKRFFSARDMALAFVRAVPTRVTDIEADLLESGQARFSSPPKAIGRGTKVGVAAVERELMLGDDELEDDLDEDEDDDRSRTLSDWGDVLEGDESMELALEPTTPAPPVAPSRPSARPSRRVLEVGEDLEDGSSHLSDADALASTDTEDPLPVRKLRVDVLGAGIAVLAVAGAVIWFPMRPSSTNAAPTPEKPTVAAPTEVPSVSADTPKAAAPNVLAASPNAELAPGAASALVASVPSSSAIATAAPAAPRAVVPSAVAQPPVAKGAGKTGASAPQPAGGSPKSTNHEDLGF
jgi:serine/threonine protein kinase